MRTIQKETALAYLAAGLSVLPARRAEKRPAVGSWKRWSERLPTEYEVEAWFANAHDAICIVAGAVSGNLECLDFDNHGELFGAWRSRVDPSLFARCVIERSPSGGCHVLYRSEGSVDGNLKLAKGIREGKELTLIETRGEGGLFLCAPSDGYVLQQGDFTRLPLLTAEERTALLEAARGLDERSVKPNAECRDAVASAASASFAVRPGDDFNARGDIRPYLLANGWQSRGVKTDGNEEWTRPGKNPGAGVSATLKDGVFYVFSSNAAPFKPEKGYSLFHVYALLEHRGDFSASANALLAKGFGSALDPCAGVDLSGLCVKTDLPVPKETPEACATDKVDDPGPIPAELLDVPGFISDAMDYTMRMAHYPNRVAAFGGALAMLSHLSGRRFRLEDGTRLNLYLIALGNSGVGKECPRTCNIRLAKTMGYVSELGDTFASGEGLEDALAFTPAMLFQVDEVDYLFNTVKLKDARAEHLSSMMLKLYSESSTVHRMRVKARTENNIMPVTMIIEPHLVFFGTATPRFFYQSMSERAMENGLMARCLVMELGARGKMNMVRDEPPPEGVLKFIKAIRNPQDAGNMASVAAMLPLEPSLRVIRETDEATAALLDYRLHADEIYDRMQPEGAYNAMALWARAGEKVAKLAGLYALSADPVNPVVTVEAIRWAGRFVDHLTRRMLYMAGLYVYDGEFDAKMKSAERMIRDSKNPMPRWRLLKNLHVDRDEYNRIIETMVESAVITRTVSSTGGEVYRIVR